MNLEYILSYCQKIPSDYDEEKLKWRICLKAWKKYIQMGPFASLNGWLLKTYVNAREKGLEPCIPNSGHAK